MNKKKDSRISREALQRLRDSIIADSDHPAPDYKDADADQELLYGALSQLRKVRWPGKEDLTVEEAVKAAHYQHVAFLKWCRSGQPIGGVKCWIDGKEEFTVRHDLHEITYGMPPPEDAVLQITTHADGEDIVLYSLRLQDVPLDGLKEIKYLPNGQHISLTIERRMGAAASQGSNSQSSEAKFRVKIAVNAEPLEQEIRAEDSVRRGVEDDEAAETDTNKYRTKFPFFNLEAWLTPFSSWPARFAVVALAVLPVCCVLLHNTLMATQEAPAKQKEVVTATNLVAKAAAVEQQNEKLSSEAGKEVPKEPASTSSPRPGDNKGSVVLNHGKRKPATRNVSVNWHSALLPPVPHFGERKAETPDDKESYQVKKIAAGDVTRRDFFAQSGSSQRNRFAMLAALSQVSVRLQDQAVTETTEASLRSIFALAFGESPRFKLLTDSDRSTPDVVIVLRYEPNEANVGVVFVDMRDSNGGFIFQDYADCEKTASTDQAEMFSVAAESLVAKLEKAIDHSKQPRTR